MVTLHYFCSIFPFLSPRETLTTSFILYLQVCLYIEINVKRVKVTLEQATKAQRGSRSIALLLL
jgi:hypothetical protein